VPPVVTLQTSCNEPRLFFPVTLRIDTVVDGFMNTLYVITC